MKEAFFTIVIPKEDKSDNLNKVFEELMEWQKEIVSGDTEREKEELIDLINALCVHGIRRFGYLAFKNENFANCKDVASRYEV